MESFPFDTFEVLGLPREIAMMIADLWEDDLIAKWRKETSAKVSALIKFDGYVGDESLSCLAIRDKLDICVTCYKICSCGDLWIDKSSFTYFGPIRRLTHLDNGCAKQLEIIHRIVKKQGLYNVYIN